VQDRRGKKSRPYHWDGRGWDIRKVNLGMEKRQKALAGAFGKKGEKMCRHLTRASPLVKTSAENAKEGEGKPGNRNEEE